MRFSASLEIRGLKRCVRTRGNPQQISPLAQNLKGTAERRLWLSQVAIHQLLEVAQRSDGSIVVERQHLHHHDAADMLHRIDPELGVINTSPAHTARAAKLRVLRIAGGDLKTEAEFIVAGTQRKWFGMRWFESGLQLHKDGPDVVLAHHLYRALAEDFCRPQVASVEQHLHEPAVVLNGRVEAAIAAERGGWRRRDRPPRLFLQLTVGAGGRRGHARLFGEWHSVRGVHHAQRLENVLMVVSL